MKKKISIICLLSMMFVLFTGFSSSQSKVYDDADLLTYSEIAQLQELLVDTAMEIECDLIVVTTDYVGNKSSMTYAEDFFMAHKFGYDTTYGDAVLLLINMDDREIWIATSGEAKYVMTDSRIDKTTDKVADYLSDGDYYEGCEAFVKYIKKYYKGGSSIGGDLEVEDILIRFVISLVIAGIVVLILRSSAKAKMTVDGHFYAKNNSCRVVNRSDVFIRTTVTKVPRSQSSGGGHSSIHVGSGGHSFGGGGRKF